MAFLRMKEKIMASRDPDRSPSQIPKLAFTGAGAGNGSPGGIIVSAVAVKGVAAGAGC